MKVRSLRAAAVTDPTALGRAPARSAQPDDGLTYEIDSMNPFGHDPAYAGTAARFAPPLPDVVCIATGDDGTFGIGMTTLGAPVASLINDYLESIVVEQVLEGPADLDRIYDELALGAGSHIGLSGLASYAISAIDLALWDLFGKAEKRPVFELLGGAARPHLDCYATGSFPERYIDMGYKAVKIPLAWAQGPDASLARLHEDLGTAREIVGNGELMLDCWSVVRPDDAVAIAEATAPYNLRWIEDYLFPEDFAGYLDVRRRIPGVPLASGERWYGVYPFQLMAEAGAVDFFQPDVEWVGGITPTRRIADIASAHGITLALHCTANDPYGQHAALALEANTVCEMYLGASTAPETLDTLRPLAGTAVPVDGIVRPSGDPGFGITIGLDEIEAATR